MTQKINQQDLIGFRQGNLLLNGSMDIWNESTTFSGVSSGYTAEGWEIARNFGSAFNVTRSTDVPNDTTDGAVPIAYSLNIACSTADVTGNANRYVTMSQKIEGYVFRRARRRTVPFVGWFKTNKPGKYHVAFRNAALNRSVVYSMTINQADVWEKKTFKVRFGTETTGVYDFINGVGIQVSVVLQANSDWLATAEDTWEAANKLATAGQVNFADSTSNYFRMTLLQLDPDGGAYVPFGGSFLAERNLSTRYYEKSYDPDVAPGTVTAVGAEAVGTSRTGTVDWCKCTFKEPKRAIPSVGIYSPTTGTFGSARNDSAANDIATASSQVGTTGFCIQNAVGDGVPLRWHWIASARL